MGQKAVDFFPEVLRHVKGEWAGQPVQLEEWQADRIIRPLFGWVDEAGFRRYRICYVEIPRKNGKSTLSAGIALLLAFADHEPGAEVYSCAADRDQAAIVFDVGKQMVEASSFLSERSVAYKRTILFPASSSVYRVLSADAFSKHGLNASGVIFDEFHTQPNRALFDVMLTATGARRQPLIVIITTAGYDRNSICYDQHKYAINVRDGIYPDPTFLPVIYSAEEDLKKDSSAWKKEATWRRCNPNYGISIKPENFRTEFNRAMQSPAYENTFKRLFLNMWTEQATRWMPMEEVWDKLAGSIKVLRAWDPKGKPMIPKELKGRFCIGGMDLASTIDVGAFVLIFPPTKDGEPYVILCYFWVPEDRVITRTEKEKVPYKDWVDQGWIKATEGTVIDYDVIRQDINDLSEIVKLKKIGYDPWNAQQLATQLEGDGFEPIKIRQGFGSLSGATKHLMTLALSGQIEHCNNPVLRWMMANVSVKQDPTGSLKPDKSTSSEKIDGVSALIDGIAVMILTPEKKESVYERRGVIAV